MVRAGLLTEEWRATENSRRAKYYSIAKRGRKQLEAETKQWDRQISAIARIIEASQEIFIDLASGCAGAER
jgi:PadR family transcriptional regulator, regulatory protein PadR